MESLQWVLSPSSPYTTWQPCCSSRRAQAMLACSSKRALISTSASTCLPASAASIKASMMGESPDVRYRVCLMASTWGSSAACSMNRCTLVANESYGWCNSTSRCLRAANRSAGLAVSTSARCGWVEGTKVGYLSSARSRSVRENSPRRSSGAGSMKTSFSVMSSSVTNSSSIFGSMSSSTSSRTGGRPTLRRSSSFSRASSRFSASSSSTSRSSLRVTRNVWCCTTCMPLKSWSRCRAITSSNATNRPSASCRNRGSTAGTFTRANCRTPVTGFLTSTARLIDSPEM